MKLIEVIVDEIVTETVAEIAKKNNAVDFRLARKNEEGRQAMRILLQDDTVQSTLDALQTVVNSYPASRLIVFPVEATLPLPEEAKPKKKAISTSREALYDSVSKDVKLNPNFIVLVILSTVVATIGLIENNVAVVIGAMVIAPLLAPNLALGLGAALGDINLMRKVLVTNLVGVSLCISLSILIGLSWPFEINSPELLARTNVGMDSLALASSAALLLIANVVCLNLATKILFWIKGISPRTGGKKKRPKGRCGFLY